MISLFKREKKNIIQLLRFLRFVCSQMLIADSVMMCAQQAKTICKYNIIESHFHCSSEPNELTSTSITLNGKGNGQRTKDKGSRTKIKWQKMEMGRRPTKSK